MTIQTNLKMIKLLLDDIRLGAKVNSNDSKALRYLLGNIYNFAVHKEQNVDKCIDEPDFVYMSESFKKAWEDAGSPSGGSALSKFGIYEHRIPLKVIINKMIVECNDEQSILDFVCKSYKMVFVTKSEDENLNAAGYRDKMPESGQDRYDVVGIAVHPVPIVYKNLAKYRTKG